MFSYHFDIPCSSYKLWKKRCFCWLFKMTYNVQIHNFLWVHFFDLGVWRWIVGNLILFKIRFGWFISHKVWENYAWSKLSWLFLQNPNLSTFESWWAIFDESWSNLDQMMNYPSKRECWQKILKFDCIWVTVDFCPSTVDFWTFEQLTEQTSSARLEIWHGWSWEHIMTLVIIWGHLDSRVLMQHKTLIWGWLP